MPRIIHRMSTASIHGESSSANFSRHFDKKREHAIGTGAAACFFLQSFSCLVCIWGEEIRVFECVNEYAARSNVKYVKIYRFPRSPSFILSSYAQTNERGKKLAQNCCDALLLDSKSYISLVLFFFLFSLTSLYFHSASVGRFDSIVLITTDSDASRPERQTKSIKFIDLQSSHIFRHRIFLHTLKTNRIPSHGRCNFLASRQDARKKRRANLDLFNISLISNAHLFAIDLCQSIEYYSLVRDYCRHIDMHIFPLDWQDIRGSE
jgi:hypothetical protein